MPETNCHTENSEKAAVAPAAPMLSEARSAVVVVHWLIPAAVALTAVTAMTGNSADADLWGHVVYGRELIQDGRVPETTTWSYITQGQRWINHENLSEILLAWAADTGGVLGLSLGKLALGLVVVACLIWTSRRGGAGWAATALCTVAAASTIHFHWQFRPHAITYTCFAVMVAGLSWAFEPWQGTWRSWSTSWRGTSADVPPAATCRINALLVLPVLFVFWTNSHGGFAAGVAVLFAYLGLRSLEAWAWWGRAATSVILRLAGVGLLVAAATLLNPYGSDLHAWMFYDVLPARPEIIEWRPLGFIDDIDTFLPVWLLLGLGTLGLMFTSRRRDITQLTILAIILWQGVSHLRHIVFFAILCGCWLAPHLQGLFDRFSSRLRTAAVGLSPAQSSTNKAWFAPVAIVAWMLFLLSNLCPRLADVQVKRAKYPVAAMQYVHDHNLTGNFMVEMNWAQYAIMCFAENPEWTRESRVAIDGRLRTCYPWETLDIYFDFALGDGGPDLRNRSSDSPPFDAGRILKTNAPDLVLLHRQQTHSIRTMAAHSAGWVLLYQDQVAQLWGRSDRYDDPAHPDYIAASSRSISDAPQIGSVNWPALPQPTSSKVGRNSAGREVAASVTGDFSGN